jgi:hypothetical protein
VKKDQMFPRKKAVGMAMHNKAKGLLAKHIKDISVSYGPPNYSFCFIHMQKLS